MTADRASRPEWISEADAAELIGVSRATIRKLIALGELHGSDASPPGSRRKLIRVRHDELAAFMERRQCPSMKPPPLRRRRRHKTMPNHLGL